MNKKELLLQKELRLGNKKVLESIYIEHKKAFINYGKGFNISEDSLLDTYQDAVISLFQNFEMKQLVLESSSVKTYLFGIGKFMILSELKQRKRPFIEVNDGYVEVEIEPQEQTIESKKLSKGFDSLGEKCKEILRLFYYRNLSISEIVRVTHYKDENTVKSHKSRCMKQLKELIKIGSL